MFVGFYLRHWHWRHWPSHLYAPAAASKDPGIWLVNQAYYCVHSMEILQRSAANQQDFLPERILTWNGGMNLLAQCLVTRGKQGIP